MVAGRGLNPANWNDLTVRNRKGKVREIAVQKQPRSSDDVIIALYLYDAEIVMSLQSDQELPSVTFSTFNHIAS